jgi:hypothetical protein
MIYERIERSKTEQERTGYRAAIDEILSKLNNK